MEQMTITAKVQIVATDADKVLLDETMSVYRDVIIPGISEPPVRTLRATIPENERHIFR